MTEPTKCPKCGTMLTDPATQEFRTWPSEIDGSDHHLSRCRDVLLAQRDEARAKLETATRALEDTEEWLREADYATGTAPREWIRAALEKLRGQ